MINKIRKIKNATVENFEHKEMKRAWEKVLYKKVKLWMKTYVPMFALAGPAINFHVKNGMRIVGSSDRFFRPNLYIVEYDKDIFALQKAELQKIEAPRNLRHIHGEIIDECVCWINKHGWRAKRLFLDLDASCTLESFELDGHLDHLGFLMSQANKEKIDQIAIALTTCQRNSSKIERNRIWRRFKRMYLSAKYTVDKRDSFYYSDYGRMNTDTWFLREKV